MRDWTGIMLIIAAFAVAAMIFAIGKAQSDCDERGGVLVRSSTGLACVDPR